MITKKVEMLLERMEALEFLEFSKKLDTSNEADARSWAE